MNRKKLYEKTSKYVNSNTIRIAILFIPLLLKIIDQIKKGKFVIDDFYDTSILVSFFFIFICEGVSKVITDIVSKKTEDAVKLETNYKELSKKYEVEKNKMIKFTNTEKQETYIPVILLVQRNLHESCSFDFDIELDRDKPKYNLPKQIADNALNIFDAHSNSVVYNNVNIRLNDLQVCGNKLKLCYSYTTYFDSLLTNRAMDYQFKPGRTVREIYEPGPFLSELSKSKLSNHLGFNGFVELKDGNIIFVKRGNQLSIAKGMWQQSIGASLKTKYCVDSEHNFTVEGISKAICMEINDELKLGLEYNENTQYEKNIFAFYRDLVEGGKPQFLFYFKTDFYDKNSFVENFYQKINEKEVKKNNEKKQIIDGERFAFLTIDELKRCKFTEECMIVNGTTKYHMMPSSIASIIMLLNNI